MSQVFHNKKVEEDGRKGQPVGITRGKEVAGGSQEEGSKGTKRNGFGQHQGLSRAELQKVRPTWGHAIMAKRERM